MNIQHPEQKEWLQDADGAHREYTGRSTMRPSAGRWTRVDRGGRIRAIPARPLRGPQAVLESRVARPRMAILDEVLERAANDERARGRHRDGPPRTPEGARQHRRQEHGPALLASSRATSTRLPSRAPATSSITSARADVTTIVRRAMRSSLASPSIPATSRP